MSTQAFSPSEGDCGVVAAVSHKGHVRDRNEDAFHISIEDDGLVLVVCDGVSSTSGADVAATVAARSSSTALAEAMKRRPTERVRQREYARLAMSSAIRRAWEAVAAIPHHGLRTGAPSCTIVAAMFDGTELTIGSVGDSRAYWVTERDAHCLTSDDSLAREMELQGAPPLPVTDPLAHAITRWIGAGAPDGEPEIISHCPAECGHLVLCTDGLWHYLRTASELAALVRRVGSHGPSGIAQSLVDRALAEGGHDNVTVAVAATPKLHR